MLHPATEETVVRALGLTEATPAIREILEDADKAIHRIDGGDWPQGFLIMLGMVAQRLEALEIRLTRPDGLPRTKPLNASPPNGDVQKWRTVPVGTAVDLHYWGRDRVGIFRGIDEDRLLVELDMRGLRKTYRLMPEKITVHKE